MAENVKLRDRLESEKLALSSDITALQNHLAMTEKLASTNRLPADLYNAFASVSSLDPVLLQPRLTLRKPTSTTPVKDSFERLRDMQAEMEEIQSEILDLSQKRTDLAIEEQKLNAKRSSFLQEIALFRSRCDELLLQKEKLEGEVREFAALLEFWRERNGQSELALQAAMEQLGAFQEEKDVKSVQLLEDLQSLYTILDEASEILHGQVRDPKI
jgi:DNA repair exonuclease SbcCD ATPase subunit